MERREVKEEKDEERRERGGGKREGEMKRGEMGRRAGRKRKRRKRVRREEELSAAASQHLQDSEATVKRAGVGPPEPGCLMKPLASETET